MQSPTIYPPQGGGGGGLCGSFVIVKPSPGGGNFVKSVYHSLYTKVLQLLLCSTVMPQGYLPGVCQIK